VNVTDNCGATLFQTAGLPSGSIFPTGVTTNSFAAADLSGNTANCSFTVTINDTQAPSIACPTDVTVSAISNSCLATNVSLSTPVFSDNCGSVMVRSNVPASFPVGTNF